MRYFIFPKSRAASLTARKKWPHIPWRKSRRNCNIVAAVYAGCFPSNITNIAVLVPKAWIASLFSAFNNGSHAKLCRGSVLPCSITLFSPLERSYKKRRAVVLPCSITLSAPLAQNLLQSFHSPFTHLQRFIFWTIYIFKSAHCTIIA